MLFFQCSESSQQKMFWKVVVLTFFPEILEKHQPVIFFFHIAACCRATLLLQRLLKSQVVTKCFSLIRSWQLCRATISKNTIFSCTASAATTADYNVDYIIWHHCG